MEERGNDARGTPRRKVLEAFTARFYDYGYQDVSSRFKKRLLQQHTRELDRPWDSLYVRYVDQCAGEFQIAN